MRLTFRYPAGEHQRFAPQAWDSAVGHPVALPSGGEGEVVAVEVVEDGAAVLLTVEADLPGLDPTAGLSLGEDP